MGFIEVNEFCLLYFKKCVDVFCFDYGVLCCILCMFFSYKYCLYVELLDKVFE